MPNTQIVTQPSFFSGQVDPIQFTRTSFQNYLSAAQSLKNCVVDTTGIIHKRDGSTIIKDLNQKYDLLIGFNANDNKWYAALFRDFAVQIYDLDGQVDQRLVTKYADPSKIDYTYIDNSIVIFYGGTIEEGALPPTRLFIGNDGEFKLEELTFKPLPSRDFNDVTYVDSNVSVNGNTVSLNIGGFDDKWIGGAIIGINPNPDLKDTNTYLGEGIITDVSVSDNSTVFTLDIIHPFGDIRSGLNLSIRKPMFGPKIGWPKKGILYANRLWLSGIPGSSEWLVGSSVGKPTAFHFFNREVDGIAGQVPITDRKETIIWLHAGSRLEVYTDHAVYTSASNDGVVTPANFQLVKRTTFGASDKFKPISYQNESYYISRTGNSLIKFEHDILTNTGKAVNVTKAAQTLIRNPNARTIIVGTSATQDNYIYGLNDNKQLFNFQFSNETGLAAVTPIEMKGDVLSIAELDNTLVLLKHLYVSDTYTLEILSSDLNDKYAYLDSMNQYQSNENKELTGLKPYNGYPARVVYFDKYNTLQDLGEYKVVNSKIKLKNYYDDNTSFYVGFTYSVEITPMYFYLGPNQSTTKKTVSQVIVEYYDSLDFYVDNSLVKYQDYKEINDKLLPKTGCIEQSFLKGHERYNTFKITQKSPFNLCITSISYKITGAYV